MKKALDRSWHSVIRFVADILHYDCYNCVSRFQIADLLTREDLSHLGALDSDLDISVEAAVRHSMAVAHLSVEPHRSLLVKNCQRVSMKLNPMLSWKRIS